MTLPPSSFRALSWLGVFLLGAGLVLMLLGRGVVAGVLATAGFASLALAFQSSLHLRSYAYTMGIFAAVAVSLTFPDVFRRVGDFNLQRLIVPLLQVIMFGMGAQLSLRDFARVVAQPKGLGIGVVCQFSIMPLIGFTLAKTFGFPPEIGAGLILIGCVPSGLASNVMAFLARANLALSVSLTLAATVLSPLLTPALMKLLAGQFIPIDFWAMMLSITNMVILPVVAGLAFNAVAYGREGARRMLLQMAGSAVIILVKNALFHATTSAGIDATLRSALGDLGWFLVLPVAAGWLVHRVTGGSRAVVDRATAAVSMLGIGVIITIITAAGRDNLLQIGALLVVACLLHNLLGYVIGYGLARLLGLNQTDGRTVALEVGLQNGGLASGIALELGKVATVGLAPAVFGPLMNITGSSLATRWRGRPVTDGSGPRPAHDPIEAPALRSTPSP
jgi:BASS family bile acid:Na+ symporter